MAVEFSLPADGDETGTNGHLGGARAGGKKAGGARDQLVEMRFYVPGTVTNKVKKEDGGEEAENGEEEEEEEEQNAASLFYDTLMDKAEIGEVAGDTFATFLDVLHLTPRFATSMHDFAFVLLIFATEVVSTSIYTRRRLGFAGKRTTTRYSTSMSRSSCSSQSPMVCIIWSAWASIHRFGKVRLGTRSLSCSSSVMRNVRSTLI